MKIDNSLTSINGGSVSENRTAKKSPAAGSDAPRVDGVSVQLSPLSSSVQSLQSGLSGSDGVVDTAQVAEIRQAIAEGRFQINSGAIADRLIESVKELLGQTRQ